MERAVLAVVDEERAEVVVWVAVGLARAAAAGRERVAAVELARVEVVEEVVE